MKHIIFLLLTTLTACAGINTNFATFDLKITPSLSLSPLPGSTNVARLSTVIITYNSDSGPKELMFENPSGPINIPSDLAAYGFNVSVVCPLWMHIDNKMHNGTNVMNFGTVELTGTYLVSNLTFSASGPLLSDSQDTHAGSFGITFSPANNGSVFPVFMYGQGFPTLVFDQVADIIEKGDRTGLPFTLGPIPNDPNKRLTQLAATEYKATYEIKSCVGTLDNVVSCVTNTAGLDGTIMIYQDATNSAGFLIYKKL